MESACINCNMKFIYIIIRGKNLCIVKLYEIHDLKLWKRYLNSNLKLDDYMENLALITKKVVIN